MGTRETREVIQGWLTGLEEMGVRKAFEKYCAKDIIGHNPTMPLGGYEAGIDYIEDEFSRGLKVEIQRLIVDGDLGAAHMHFKFTDGSPDYAILDIYRVENGKIVECWDLQQAIPEKTVSGNSMF